MMRSKKGKIFLFFLLFFILFSKADFVLALEVNYPPVFGVEPPQVFMEKIENEEPGYEPEKALPLYVKYFYALFLVISGMIAFFAIVLGGLSYLFSVGSPAKMKMARNQITAGFTGLIVLLSSYLILTIINPQLIIFHISKEGPISQQFHKECIGGRCLPVPGEGEDQCDKDIECPSEGKTTYIKIPFGILIQSITVKAEIAKNEAEDVDYVGEKLKEMSQCVAALSARCGCQDCHSLPDGCDVLTQDCVCEDPSVPDLCSPNGCCQAGDDDCETGTCNDPCQRCINTHYCQEFFNVDNLCAGLGNDLGCPTDSCNLRDVIDSKRPEINSLAAQLLIEKEDAEIAKVVLEQELVKLKAAEALMRDAHSHAPPISYHNFASIEKMAGPENFEEKELGIWKDIDISYPARSGPPLSEPPKSCSGDKFYEITPSCTICRSPEYPAGGLFCFGNEFRLCPTDSRIEALCTPLGGIPGSGSPLRDCVPYQWFPRSDFPGGIVKYNGVDFLIPPGGLEVLESNAYPGWKCPEETNLIIAEDDPSIFWVREEGNEDLIAIIESINYGKPPITPPPTDPGPYPEPPGDIPPIGSVRAYAEAASVASGVRASLILAVLYHESGYQQFPGTGHYKFDLCEGGCIEFDKIWENCSRFEEIWDEVGDKYPFYTDIQDVPVSAQREICINGDCLYHCGGAMGPAQAMPYTWPGFALEVKRITGNDPPSPWEFDDAFVFAGLHLRDRYFAKTNETCKQTGGASGGKCLGEACSVFAYVGGHRDHATAMVGMADKIADVIGENKCSP